MERYLFRSYFSLPLSTIYHYRRNKKRFSVSIDNHGAFIISTFAWSFRATISWKITRQARNKIPGLTSCNDTISCLNRHRIIGLRRKRTVPRGDRVESSPTKDSQRPTWLNIVCRGRRRFLTSLATGGTPTANQIRS